MRKKDLPRMNLKGVNDIMASAPPATAEDAAPTRSGKRQPAKPRARKPRTDKPRSRKSSPTAGATPAPPADETPPAAAPAAPEPPAAEVVAPEVVAPEPPHRDRSNEQLSVIVPRYVADQIKAAVARGTTRRSIVLRALAKDGFTVDEADLADRRKAVGRQRHIDAEVAKLVDRGATLEEIREYKRKASAGAVK